MAAKPVKPTAQQLAQAKLRARSSGIPMDTSAKGLRNAGKAIMVGASFLPAGRAVKGAATVAKAASGARKAKTVVSKLATPKSNVNVLPRKTAPKTDLSNRGARPTRTERSERAADLSFNKLESRMEGEYLTRMTGLRGPKGVTSQSTRGQGKRSLRKETAINKEAKNKIIKINSQRNLKAK